MTTPTVEISPSATAPHRPLPGRARGAADRSRGPPATPTEREAELLQRRVRPARWTRGYDLLWRDFECGREVTFDRVLPIRLGRMWPPRQVAKAA